MGRRVWSVGQQVGWLRLQRGRALTWAQCAFLPSNAPALESRISNAFAHCSVTQRPGAIAGCFAHLCPTKPYSPGERLQYASTGRDSVRNIVAQYTLPATTPAPDIPLHGVNAVEPRGRRQRPSQQPASAAARTRSSWHGHPDTDYSRMARAQRDHTSGRRANVRG